MCEQGILMHKSKSRQGIFTVMFLHLSTLSLNGFAQPTQKTQLQSLPDSQPLACFSSLIVHIQAFKQNALTEGYWHSLFQSLDILPTQLTTQTLSILLTQLVLLIGCIWVLIKASQWAPTVISNWQKKLIKSALSIKTKKLSIIVLNFIKPNISWLTIVFSCFLLAELFSTQPLFPANLLMLFGFIYGAYRFLRVFTEWLLQRGFTRAGKFITNTYSKEVEFFSKKISTQLTLIFLFCYLLYQKEFCLWFSFGIILFIWLWALSSYVALKNPLLIEYYFPINVKTPRSLPQKLLFVFLAPILFFSAQLLDWLQIIHEQLLNIESYQLLSVKFLRAKMVKKIDPSVDQEANPSFKNYADILQRPLDEHEFVDRPKQLSDILNRIKEWYSGQIEENALLVIGDQGSGKSVLTRLLAKQLPDFLADETVLSVRIEINYRILDEASFFSMIFDHLLKALTEHQIIDSEIQHNKPQLDKLTELDQKMPPTIIIMDNLSQLYLSEVGCFQAYKALLSCLNAHFENIFWVLTIQTFGWAYISKVFYREQWFSFITALEKWSAIEIKNLVMSRHTKTHRKLVFNQMLFSASATSESASIRSAESRVFNLLWEQSEGNPEAAVSLWLRATKLIGSKIEVGVPKNQETTELMRMDDELLFVYSAIVKHRNLSFEEMIKATNLSAPIVRHAIKQGINIGLLDTNFESNKKLNSAINAQLSENDNPKNRRKAKKNQTISYQVSMEWYESLKALLLSKNMLSF